MPCTKCCIDNVTTRWRGHGCAGVIAVAVVGIFIVLESAFALAQYQPATLSYMLRGDRHEGLVTELKSAEDIRLLSAVTEVRRRDTYPDWPSTLRLRFYLPRDEEAHVTLRQIPAPKGYYLLGDVMPGKPWAMGAVNEFRWPATVIAGVYDYQVPAARRAEFTKDDWMTDLGVVVSLGDAGDAAIRQKFEVAPAVLFHSDQPLEVTAYQFIFRTNAPASVQDSILSSSNTRVFLSPNRSVIASRPFTIRWQVAGQPEGWYQLSLDVAFSGATSGGSQQRVVRFYHKQSLSVAK